jgi:hypothetical protein
MNITRRGLMAAAAGGALFAAGCAGVTLAPAGDFRTERAFTVTLQQSWSDITALLMPRPPGVHLLTRDGPALNQLYLASIEPGASLFRHADRDTPAVTYRADMSDTELVEFVIDSLAVTYQEPEASALRPQALAGAPGVRFDISARTQAGLNMSGTALVARAGEKLSLMVFLAPSEHYYPAYAPEIDTIFSSARAA